VSVIAIYLRFLFKQRITEKSVLKKDLRKGAINEEGNRKERTE